MDCVAGQDRCDMFLLTISLLEFSSSVWIEYVVISGRVFEPAEGTGTSDPALTAELGLNMHTVLLSLLWPKQDSSKLALHHS